jgi:hypothetical protein
MRSTVRKWGAWAASAVFVLLTGVLAIAQSASAEGKGAAAVRPVAPAASGRAAGIVYASADRDVLDLQLD